MNSPQLLHRTIVRAIIIGLIRGDKKNGECGGVGASVLTGLSPHDAQRLVKYTVNMILAAQMVSVTYSGETCAYALQQLSGGSLPLRILRWDTP
ncbi:hypothetical protein Tco_0906420 [Tanacetum coccineum]|uniref:Uncharacterized protein n=1 Tax=Tanacetum coccineum TaxID=301880 RepID=A0ABQ5CGF2_9ASTR